MINSHCPRCGHLLEKRRLENTERGFCPACKVPVYENPVPATAVMVFNDRGELLLVQRGQEPGKGKWCLPGGFQETGETPEQCALRELHEETGIAGRVEGLIAMEMSPNPLVREVLVIGYRVGAVGGALKAGDDALDAAYFPLGKLPEIAFASHARLIARAVSPLSHANADLKLPWGAYVITSRDHARIAREACAGGARIVQYRDKDAPAAQRLEKALQIRSVTRECGTLFIVNDQLDIALLSEADGVHLGQDDLPPTEARRITPPGFIIGVSTHSLEQARAAERQGADYIGIGPVFATPTKENYPSIGLETLRQVAATVTIPLVAIGGINLGNMTEVKGAGVRNVAMVREFQNDTAAKVAVVNSFFILSK
jgi:thiamine-phosphate pyrophosphorylase